MSVLILFVMKANNDLRFCIDYKKLNTFIIKNRCLFFSIDEILNRLMNAAYFIKFDFRNVYHRIKIYKSNE